MKILLVDTGHRELQDLAQQLCGEGHSVCYKGFLGHDKPVNYHEYPTMLHHPADNGVVVLTNNDGYYTSWNTLMPDRIVLL